jgi:hypothetical protein
MRRTPTDPAPPEREPRRLGTNNVRRVIAAVLLALPLAGLGAASLAALKPKIENPHGSFKGDCSLCHGSSGWTPAKISPKFNHAAYGFALTGAHATTKCTACHASLDFSQSRKLCVTCHEDPHRGEMGTDCSRCHSSRSFIDRAAMTRAHQSTSFPLTGSHAQLECETCHKTVAQGQMQFVGTRADCQSCHMDQYRSTKNPDHVAGGFPLECATCHSTLTWSTKNFDHNRTAFPLTGAHRTAACMSCHGDGVYKGKSTDCYSCHKSNYDGTTNPAHASLGYSTACASCHNTTSWDGATFNHNTTPFPLTGAHVNVPCASCHIGGVYQGTSTDCYSCHKTDYDGTNNPAHAGAGFPTACVTCHNTTAWTGATFNHDTPYFPIYSGTHNGRWSACSDCHTNPANYAVFTCLSCHPHSDQAQTDGNHSGVSGYHYDSASCYSCHPKGRAG